MTLHQEKNRIDLIGLAVALCLVTWSNVAYAQQESVATAEKEKEPMQPVASSASDSNTDELELDDKKNEKDDWGILLAGKAGGVLPFSDLGLMAAGAIELGFVFGGTGRSIVALLDISYTAPSAEGNAEDSRLQPPGDSGDYSWTLTQKQLTLQPTFVYRFTDLVEPFVPYAGIGPRLYLLESVIEGTAGDSKLPESVEQSTSFGFGIPLGCEFELGPGGLFVELLFQWGPLAHKITGDSHLGSSTVWLGYRAIL